LPLSERARIEVYLPELSNPAYQDLLENLEREFTHTFGGCSIVRAVEGSYLSRLGSAMKDRINLLFTDIPLNFATDFASISRYADSLRQAAFSALTEEAALVVAYPVYHSR
jgi:hypothetical protein